MSTIRSFLGGIVDYAGLFPPAGLPLDQALRHYARYRDDKDAWLLGRFVCPASRLDELVSLVPDSIQTQRPLVVAALGRGGRDAQEYCANVEADLADIARCRVISANRIVVDAYEVRLPEAALNPSGLGGPSCLIARATNLIEISGAPSLTPFFEAPAARRDVIVAVLQALDDDRHAAQANARQHCGRAGFKLRTGGLEPAAVPSSEQVAFVLSGCAKNRVPFKATAGLHHPFRHFNSQINALMHGFVNVFTAGCLAMVHRLDEAHILAIVEDENPEHFHLEPAGLRWRDLTATTAELAQARTLFTSFGSCSFDEPLDDLRCLGWIEDG